MASPFPIEHYRAIYRQHMEHAARFGISTNDFNERIGRRRGRHHNPSPQMWASYAYMEVKAIAGHRCCPKAEVAPCYCEVRYTCTDHGSRCVGNHD